MAKKKSPALRSVVDALTSPQTRQERYLANIAGLVATKPDYPFTRLERYLDAIAQNTGGSADAIEELKQNKLNVYGGGVNLLDNWYFVGGGSQRGGEQFPINQRRQTNYVGTANYLIDRWRSYLDVSISDEYITISKSASSAGSSFVQYLNAPAVRGRQLVFSILTGDNVLHTGKFSFPKIYPTEPNRQTTYLNYNIGSGIYLRAAYDTNFTPGRADVRIVVLNNGSSIDVKAAKLELGDTQTLAHQDANGDWVLNDPPPNFQQELAKCQRYFQVFRDQNLRPAYGMDYRPPMAKERPEQGSFVLDGVTYYTASAE